MSRLLASRRRELLSTLVVLLALDVGRSINARLGYAHPTSTWQPDPAVYADLTWPPGADGACVDVVAPSTALRKYINHAMDRPPLLDEGSAVGRRSPHVREFRCVAALDAPVYACALATFS